MSGENVNQYYLLYQKEIHCYLTKQLACAETAADLTHEAFLRLFRCDSNKQFDSPRAYLYRIARNLVNDHFRAQRKLPQFNDSDAMDTVCDEAPGQERALLAEESVRHLEEAINTLPPRCREVFILHKFHDLSYQEIAEKLGISKNTVMVHMMKALAQCRDALK